MNKVDLVIVRADGVINLREMMCSQEPYEITSAYEMSLRHKVACFASETRSGKVLHLTLVSPHGARRNAHRGVLQAEITADELFA